ncbi:DUF433 domain-containing protein [Natrinema caseinilyticum]|uniref:DUF433 domain-containing protein n=1 Tax=Natrinema caseinilyticum TaxID=2961570 RepID=UPI003CCCB7BF
MTIVRDPDHSDGAPTIEGTGIRVKDIAIAYEHSGYEPDEITQLYPDLSLSETSTVHSHTTTITLMISGQPNRHRHEADLLRRGHLDPGCRRITSPRMDRSYGS